NYWGFTWVVVPAGNAGFVGEMSGSSADIAAALLGMYKSGGYERVLIGQSSGIDVTMLTGTATVRNITYTEASLTSPAQTEMDGDFALPAEARLGPTGYAPV